MNRLATFAPLLVLALAQSESLIEEKEGAVTHQWDFFGDCIGVQQSFNGKVTNYIQSDIQFAQQVEDDIREFNRGNNGTIDENLNMSLFWRYSVKDDPGFNKMIASEFKVDYSTDFKTVISDARYQEASEMAGGDPERQKEILDMFNEMPGIPPTSHGHQFEGMFDKFDWLDLKGKVIGTYFFDQDGHFAGITLLDPVTGAKDYHVPINVESLQALLVDEEIINAHASTRIIGFRTGKECHSSMQIAAVQPIYYSVDESICKNYLSPIDTGMREEISSYGLECSDASRRVESFASKHASTKVINNIVTSDGVSKSFMKLTYIVVWCVFFLVSCLCGLQTKRFCDDRQMRRGNKNKELVGIPDTARTTQGDTDTENNQA